MEEIQSKNVQNVLHLMAKLDYAIDDVENGRVISEEELWKEIDDI